MCFRNVILVCKRSGKYPLLGNQMAYFIQRAKSDSMIFSLKVNKPYHPSISMYWQHINEVHSHKHLGLIYLTNCTWHDHIDYIKTKAWFRVNKCANSNSHSIENPLKQYTLITKTCLYNVDPLKTHIYIEKLRFTGVYIIFLISAQKHRL